MVHRRFNHLRLAKDFSSLLKGECWFKEGGGENVDVMWIREAEIL